RQTVGVGRRSDEKKESDKEQHGTGAAGNQSGDWHCHGYRSPHGITALPWGVTGSGDARPTAP
ncbi:MAG: hypothetical protein ACOC0M_11015, partial [Halomonas sp.]